ncbi:hypothetical protein H0194_01885 [Corynebacterium incognita]|uniref:DUF4878 domain-containing protein n=1 Tax=Corynebacterium incognita TaxID=2754725 RepID=A0A7G7CQG1_9CORY|nr:hypothetical protein [Corynebacterium incognita]QNE89827.1 hypothetical protein H0194_01885 [Corynebacterium incognita]
MTQPRTLSKTCMAALLVLPLALTACGPQSEEAPEGAEATPSVSGASKSTTSADDEDAKESASETETSKKKDSNKKSDSDKDDGKKVEAKEGSDKSGSDKSGSDKSSDGGNSAGGAGAAGGAAAGDEQLEEQLSQPTPTQADLTEVADGKGADAATKKEIKALVNGLYQTKTVRDLVTYIPDHTCKSVVDQQGGKAAMDVGGMQDPVLDMPAETMIGDNGVKSIKDIKVNGNKASAVVTVSTANGDDTKVQQYLKENGAWTFCAF